MTRRAALPPAFLAALLAACAPANDAPVVLFGGARYGWEDLSHRIAYLRAGVSAPADDGTFVGQLGLVGGNFTTGDVMGDTPIWSLSWIELASERVAVAQADVAVSIGPDGVGEGTLAVDLGALGLDVWPSATAALAGFTFDTDVPLSDGAPGNYDPGDGWTPQALGAVVGEAQRDGDTLFVPYTLRFKAGPLDRPPMNANVPYANIAASLRVAVVSSRSSALVPGALAARQMILRDPPFTEVLPLPAEDRTLRLAGAPGYALGVPLLRGWELILNRDLDEEGRYLRAFGVRIEDVAYDADTGVADLVFDLVCSHSSLVEEGDLQVDYSVSAALLQVRDSAGTVALGQASAAAEIGPVDVPLP